MNISKNTTRILLRYARANIVKMNIFFDSQYVTRYIKEEKISFTKLIASCVQILVMFMGFSFIAGIEIVYHVLAGCLSCIKKLSNKQEEQTSNRELQFENEKVKVWRTTIPPNQPLKMHRHEHGRVVVGLKGGTLTKIEEDGRTSPLVFETGKAYWLEADPESELHGDVNESHNPIEVMVTELQN